MTHPKRTRSWLRASVLALILAVSGPAAATIARFLPLDEHLALSTAVVRARVGEQRVFLGKDGRPRTETSLQVLEAYKGARGAGTTVVVRQMQGAIGEGFLRVPGDPVFRTGDEVVVFLRADEAGVHFLTAMGQSKYDVLRSAEGPIVFRDLGGLAFYEPRADEKVLDAPAEAAEPLSVFGQTLRDLSRGTK